MLLLPLHILIFNVRFLSDFCTKTCSNRNNHLRRIFSQLEIYGLFHIILPTKAWKSNIVRRKRFPMTITFTRPPYNHAADVLAPWVIWYICKIWCERCIWLLWREHLSTHTVINILPPWGSQWTYQIYYWLLIWRKTKCCFYINCSPYMIIWWSVCQ